MQLVTPAIRDSMASSSWIRKMFEKGIELKKRYGAEAVCDFSLGNPDVPPPAKTADALREIAAQAVRPLGLGYCPNAGIPEVREALAAWLARQQETRLAAEDVVLTVGAAGALVSFFRAVVEPGDEILTPAPYFVEYGAYCGHFGGVLKAIPSLPPTFRPDVAAIAEAITPRTRAIILNSPNNPTGAVYPAEDVAAIAALVDKVNETRERPVFILSDEPYRAFVYDGARVPAMLPFSKWTCVAGSFSKTLSLAGERIGYFTANPAMPGQQTLIAAMTLTNRTLGFVNAPVIGQRLVAALLDQTVDLDVYDRRRRLMARVLREAGVSFEMPKGAFYIFARSPVPDDLAFVDALLQEKILVVTGKGFGFGGHVRLSYSVDEKIILRAADGFKRAAERLRAQ